ncbi:putative auxin efflux carrier component 5 [Zostera marina]|uniref:Auxin efflux carrier component n=1 Tax=Zostera marina TaxID=29655 RepID=A0A0K9PB33_ZOSMR|nr:putative auxin efflux carrier component 5 [Zostera marina]
MISIKEVFDVIEATVPIYVAMLLAYISMKWFKLFSEDQSSGINKFVAKISIPFLSFHIISTNNPYKMNRKLILADIFQKVIGLVVFVIYDRFMHKGKLDWAITGLCLSTFPNTLVVGIPLIKAMYGEDYVGFLGQIIVLQTLVWYVLLLFLYELRSSMAVLSSIQGEIEEEVRMSEEIITRGNKTWYVMKIVWMKLIRNPSIGASFAGLIWALISFRWNVNFPTVAENSLSIIYDGALGMAMFSLGLFMASQSKIIACGKRMAAVTLALRFLLSPGLMALSSYIFGLRGTPLNVAIVQAAFPLGIVPFVLAKEYNLHPQIMSTGFFTSMIIAVAATLGYYYLLQLNMVHH